MSTDRTVHIGPLVAACVHCTAALWAWRLGDRTGEIWVRLANAPNCEHVAVPIPPQIETADTVRSAVSVDCEPTDRGSNGA